mmetsp:Transcript_52088/g.108745  ORF Transcript_52088/g.108745 Transcript_52088/m.108745 type:complete len:356 (+) Transcript_52088:1486-2553(+)
MGAEHERLLLLRVEVLLHPHRPQPPRRAQLGNLHVEVHADAEEEAEARREAVHARPRRRAAPHVLDAVGDGVAELEVRRGTRLLHVIAADGDGVELGHVLAGVAHDVADDAERRARRVDVGVAHHELLEDVVLDGSGELVEGGAALEGGDDVEGHDWDHGAVHRHAHRHLVERDAVEKDLHVFNGIDRHSSHPNISLNPFMIRVITAMCCEIKSNTETLLACGHVFLVKGIALFSCAKSSILTNCPRFLRVHGGIRSSSKRITARNFVFFSIGKVMPSVQRLDMDAFRCVPRQRADRILQLGLFLSSGDPRLHHLRFGAVLPRSRLGGKRASQRRPRDLPDNASTSLLANDLCRS